MRFLIVFLYTTSVKNVKCLRIQNHIFSFVGISVILRKQHQSNFKYRHSWHCDEIVLNSRCSFSNFIDFQCFHLLPVGFNVFCFNYAILSIIRVPKERLLLYFKIYIFIIKYKNSIYFIQITPVF